MSALWSGIPWCHFVHCWGLRSGNRLLHIRVCICKPWHLILLLKYASLTPREHVVSIWTEQFVRIALAWSCMDTYAVLKSFYSSEGKLPWNIDNLVSVSSMVVTTGLGSWTSSLSKKSWNLEQEMLKSCWFLVKELHNVCLIASFLHSVTEPTHKLVRYFCLQQGSQKGLQDRYWCTTAQCCTCQTKSCWRHSRLLLLPSVQFVCSVFPGTWGITLTLLSPWVFFNLTIFC